MITKEQTRAARSILDISQTDLAKLAFVGLSTVIDFEKGHRKPYKRNIEAIQSALEAKGVIFVDADDNYGVGVRMRWKIKSRLCPCCGYLTMDLQVASYHICPICNWEDDPVQNADDSFWGGANTLSLKDSRKNFKEIGVSDKRFINNIRKPLPHEIP